MAKSKRDEKGRPYVDFGEDLAERMEDPVFRAAFIDRRYVQEIARAIRSMRESAGLSQQQLADMVGMKQPAIARLETSQANTPQWKTLTRIGVALGRQLSFELGDVDLDKPLVRVRPKRAESRESREAR